MVELIDVVYGFIALSGGVFTGVVCNLYKKYMNAVEAEERLIQNQNKQTGCIYHNPNTLEGLTKKDD